MQSVKSMPVEVSFSIGGGAPVVEVLQPPGLRVFFAVCPWKARWGREVAGAGAMPKPPSAHGPQKQVVLQAAWVAPCSPCGVIERPRRSTPGAVARQSEGQQIPPPGAQLPSVSPPAGRRGRARGTALGYLGSALFTGFQLFVALCGCWQRHHNVQNRCFSPFLLFRLKPCLH